MDAETITSMNKVFNIEKGKYLLLQEQLNKAAEEEAFLEKRLNTATKARTVIQHVAQMTQKNLEFHISHIVSLALASVWPKPYEFKVNFVKRRNKTECDLVLVREGEELDPLDASGGGVCDVASFALRIAVLTMKAKVRKVLLLDEPFSFLHSNEMQRNCSKMVKALSEKMGIQVIMVSDQTNIIDYADAKFKVTLSGGKSHVQTKM